MFSTFVYSLLHLVMKITLRAIGREIDPFAQDAILNQRRCQVMFEVKEMTQKDHNFRGQIIL